MYLLDTNVISEARKGSRANVGVLAFRGQILEGEDFIPVQVIGELRRGIEILRFRGDFTQAATLEIWLDAVLGEYSGRILGFAVEAAQIWGRLSALGGQDVVDKQIAAIALLYDLTVVTRNETHFAGTGVRVLNPFSQAPGGS